MSRSLSVALLLVAVAMCSGCASIVSGQNQSLSVKASSDGSDVDGAKCSLKNDKGSWYVITPGSVTVQRSYQDLAVSCALAESTPATLAVKSSTKAMAFGNVIFGGAIGVGVDVATGAAYDYPALITVAMASGLSTGALRAPLAANAAALSWPAGTRLVYVESHPLTPSQLSESVFVLTEVSPRGWVFNNGVIQHDPDGTPRKNEMFGTLAYGAGPVEVARGGTWNGTFRAGTYGEVSARFTLLDRKSKVVSGRRFDAARVKVEGYASRIYTTTTTGAPFEGEMLIDAESGLVLELTVASRHSSYALRRELTQIVAN